ncbi:hypothetical protein KY362_05060 [Candidatus Woesearchaeota archaeon]|nr:hypothetical protein [Candidatus Woesearchaeota archaeon]
MPKRTKHTLITAELLGFFLIIVGVLGILTGKRIYVLLSVGLFALIVIAAALFAIFAIFAVKKVNG